MKMIFKSNHMVDPNMTYKKYNFQATDRIISRSEYAEKLCGFWLAQNIANWT